MYLFILLLHHLNYTPYGITAQCLCVWYTVCVEGITQTFVNSFSGWELYHYSCLHRVSAHAWCSATPSLFLIFNLTPPPPNSFLLLMVTKITFWRFWIFIFCTSRRNELCFVVLCGSWHFCLNVLNSSDWWVHARI